MATRMHTTFAFLAKAVCVPTVHNDRNRANMHFAPEAQACAPPLMYTHMTLTSM